MYGLKECSKPITAEQYKRAAQNRGHITKEDYNDVFTESERFGYGVYSDKVYEENGKFFVWYETGTHCD